jgi:hypothetical protein
VKTLQMHVVHLEDSRVEVSEEERPQVLEVLCDECETALNFDEMDETIQKELRLTLGALPRNSPRRADYPIIDPLEVPRPEAPL